jgi:hypothetical protein
MEKPRTGKDPNEVDSEEQITDTWAAGTSTPPRFLLCIALQAERDG